MKSFIFETQRRVHSTLPHSIIQFIGVCVDSWGEEISLTYGDIRGEMLTPLLELMVFLQHWKTHLSTGLMDGIIWWKPMI
jgi:hypothetical protein